MALGDMNLTAMGRLTADPELRFTPNGTPVCEFVIAVNPRERDQSGQWRDLPPSFVPVTAWKQLAENCAETLVKGVPVIVTGRWREERWEREDGRKGSTWRLTADAVGPNLNLCTAKLTPTTRRRPTAPEPDEFTGAEPGGQ